MSIGFGILLPDGALLIADSLQTYPQSREPREPEYVEKIERITDNIYGICFGVSLATERTINLLRDGIKEENAPETIKHLLNGFAQTGWNSFYSKLDKNVDRNHQSMRAGLIIGGIANDERFISSTLLGTGMKQETKLCKGPGINYFSLGGEEQRASDAFHERLQNVAIESEIGILNQYINTILDVAHDVIRKVESEDNTVGGDVSYVVIRNGFGTLSGILPDNNK